MRQIVVEILKYIGINPRNSFEVRNMLMEVKKHGGLSFNIRKYEDGWLAECTDIKGIVAGDTNPNPTQNEIDDYATR